jgi:hypothetical protein
MWHCVVWLIAIGHASPYGIVRFDMPLQINASYCDSFARAFIASEANMLPAHTARYACKIGK